MITITTIEPTIIYTRPMTETSHTGIMTPRDNTRISIIALRPHRRVLFLDWQESECSIETIDTIESRLTLAESPTSALSDLSDARSSKCRMTTGRSSRYDFVCLLMEEVYIIPVQALRTRLAIVLLF